jgi:hypothetical protein
MPATLTLRAAAPRNGQVERITLTLTPAELGVVSFELRAAPAGERSVHIAVDRPATLALLQQDRHHLDAALARAGLDADPARVTLGLAGDPAPGFDRQSQGSFWPDATGDSDGRRDTPPLALVATPVEAPPSASLPAAAFALAPRSTLDILA